MVVFLSGINDLIP